MILPKVYIPSPHSTWGSLRAIGGHSHEEENMMSEPADSGLGPQRGYEPAYKEDDTADQECSMMWDLAHSSQDSMKWSDSSQSTMSSHSSYSSGILPGIDPSDEVKSKEIQVEIWSKLADAAIRTIIGGSSTTRSDGVKLASDSDGPKLAEIAPALFSPFYAVVSINFDPSDTITSWPKLTKV